MSTELKLPFDTAGVPGAPAKPVIALMGEFSAGKSTLSNLLMGGDQLPVQVVATRLPPVWIRHGTGPARRIDLEGHAHPVDPKDLDSIDLADTTCLLVESPQDILERCDLIDMPGISDPNMAPEVWLRLLPRADAVLWCTHATQAWRQSEAAVWDSLPRRLRRHSLLLLTRFDKLVTQDDRNRVLKRVRHETSGLFAYCLPISLTQAAAAGDDPDLWAHSGADAFAKRFVELLHRLDRPARPRPVAVTGTPVPGTDPDPSARVRPRRVVADPGSRRTTRPPARDAPARVGA
jgi:hypothetical protein